jgi:CO/xanthine dehydrogenase Mo-binding subunit
MHREEGSLADAGADYQIVEGSYATSIQLHMPDAPFTVVARPGAHGSVDIHVPTQWPAHVRETVAAALSIAPRAVSVTVTPVTGSRDAALWLPSLMAIVAALAARAAGAPVTLSQRRDDRHRTGGRAPAQIRWTSRVNADGKLISNDVSADLNGGAYPHLVDETMGRMWASVRSVYRLEHAVIDATVSSSPAPPLGAFEGVGTAPMALARELHFNRLAEIAEQDPVIWRQRHIRRDWPVISELCATLAAEADFHRRYSANELVRKRRIQLPRNSATLKGIGFALSDQMSGFVAGAEGGSVAVRLEPDGVARISCSLPTPTPRLRSAWRELVANQLDLEVDSVYLDTEIDVPSHDSGPRLFSRGTSVVPRTLTAICQAINKQRFREPLPIHVRRTIKPSRAAKSPADAHHAAGAATVEVVLLPGSMEIEVRSVTIAVYAGRIMDRGMAESEIRRGVHQALAWVLHEAVPDPERASSRETVANYPINFRGRSPRIKIILGNTVRKDGPTGLGELPFLTVPAALLSALSQASGLYLDSVPVRPASILRMLMEES